MRHTSIRLSDEHMAKIAESGESPTKVIKKALDYYFNISSEDYGRIQFLINQALAEHIRQCSYRAHDMGIDKSIVKSTPHDLPQNNPGGVPIIAHSMSTNGAHNEHIVSTDAEATILAFILQEIKQGREPLLPAIAEKFYLTSPMLTKILKPYGVQAQKTTRAGIDGRYFTQAMRPKLEEILQGFL